jgi:hypothetical protein
MMARSSTGEPDIAAQPRDGIAKAFRASFQGAAAPEPRRPSRIQQGDGRHLSEFSLHLKRGY